MPYGQRALAKLRSDILASDEAGKLIFTGHRGCGKSTLLAQLSRRLREDGHFVALFSIADMVEMSDVNHINILYAIALKLLSQATKLQVPIPERTKTTLMTWFTETKSRTYSDQLKQEMGLGGKFFELFTAKLQKEEAFREEIKQTYERRVSDLSRQIDLIAAAIQAETKRPVLVIIDDLDKLDLAVVRTVFQDNIKALFSPNIRVVFTIPIAVIREPRLIATLESDGRIVMLPVTKFFPQDVAHQEEAAPLEKNVERLVALLDKRIPDELIEPEVKRKIVLLSGGVLRELVRLAQECIRECMIELETEETPDVKIDASILEVSVRSLRNQFARTLGSNLYGLLVETYRDFTPADIKSDDFLELLHGLYVLEYENDDLWYDLHPIVVDLLKRKKLI